MVKNIHSQSARSKLDLFLINSTSSLCDFNTSVFSDKNVNISLCLDEKYGYTCAPNDTNVSISLDCTLTNQNTECHSFFVTEAKNYNYSLDCFYSKLNTTLIGDQLTLKHVNECLYGLNNQHHNNSLYVCALTQRITTVTTFNNTKLSQQSSKYYKLFGFEVLKRYLILIIIALVVVFCLLVLCCYGMCRLCCPHMQSRKNSNSSCCYDHNMNQRGGNRNSNCNQNAKMPQSSAACNI